LEVESALADVDSLLGDDPKLEVPQGEYEDKVELLADVDLLLADVDSLLGEASLADVDLALAGFWRHPHWLAEDFPVLGVPLQQQTLMDCTVVLEVSH
jgi:hypothetical protein